VAHERPQTRRFLTALAAGAGRRLPDGYPASQTHQPTAPPKRPANAGLQERL